MTTPSTEHHRAPGQLHPDPENPHAGQGPVLLDIGHDAGALIITAPAALAGIEIEVRPIGRDAPARHVAVLPRPVAHGLVHAAVFGGLTPGDYELTQRPASPPRLAVRISAARLTHATWPEPHGRDATPT